MVYHFFLFVLPVQLLPRRMKVMQIVVIILALGCAKHMLMQSFEFRKVIAVGDLLDVVSFGFVPVLLLRLIAAVSQDRLVE